jgi:aminoglycoside phosphotransferase family enzyme
MSTNSIIESNILKGTQMDPLIKKDRTKIEGRLEAGTIDGFQTDLTLTKAESTGAVVARQSKKAATVSQADQIASLSVLVQAVRNGCKLKELSREILTDVGVGKPMNRSVKSVTDAATLVINAYASHVDELRRAGVLPADIEKITALRDRLTESDVTQEHRKTSSKDQTQARNAAHKRLIKAMTAIIGAAELAFAEDPERLALYRALRPTMSAAKKPAPNSPAAPQA